MFGEILKMATSGFLIQCCALMLMVEVMRTDRTLAALCRGRMGLILSVVIFHLCRMIVAATYNHNVSQRCPMR